MDDDFNDDRNLLDEDPALDYILYEEMEKDAKPRGKSSCFGIVLFVLIPLSYALLHFTVICPLTSDF